ncbi:serine/threonine protein phosphatase PrpC [Salipiger aestuarii]|uniref:Serine/threonine protein phosphatase PrpC n=1 Tax=Salipiger aestuarii TaxID=568098 RepID=A0A327XP11_9RHOB|nr:protein phosphatase 2C domain-containing protein [Salipiger aestuarii]RAK10453.1 serine/threonine protein phosphatase PrpC [Salipiger aestuarii]
MPDLVADAALAQDIGCRARQEDAAIAHFGCGAASGIAVLSDGMGGHDDGDLAGRIIAGEMFADLFLSDTRRDLLHHDARAVFGSALGNANRKLQHHIHQGHLSENTGGTLVSLIVSGDHARWLSVGDSPLWLLRDGTLTRLNENHSMAPQLDLMLAAGEIDAQSARSHAGRSALTSAVTGGSIARIDCPDTPLALRAGDLLLLASDGIETLDGDSLRNLLHKWRHKPASDIAGTLLAAVAGTRRADQDNTSVVVIRMRAPRAPTAGFAQRLCAAMGRCPRRFERALALPGTEGAGR